MNKEDFRNWLDQHRESQSTVVQDYRGHITSYEEALYCNGFRDYKVVRWDTWDKRIDEKDKALFDFTGIPEDRKRGYAIIISPFTKETLEAFLKLSYESAEWQQEQAEAQQSALERLIEMGELDEDEEE